MPRPGPFFRALTISLPLVAAALLTGCLTKQRDCPAEKLRETRIPLDALNKRRKKRSPKEQIWAMESLKQGLTQPSGINEDAGNRILWHAMKGGRLLPGS